MGSSGAADAKKLYYSLNQGKAGKAFATSAATGLTDGKIAIASNGKGVLFVPGNANALYYTADWGKSWSNLWTIAQTISGAHPYADPVDSLRFYIYCRANGFMYVAAPDSNGTMGTKRALSVGTNGSPTLQLLRQKRDLWIARNTRWCIIRHAFQKSVIASMADCQG